MRSGEIEQIVKIRGETNVANMQTKALEPARFHALFSQLPFVAAPRRVGGERVVQAAIFTLCMIGVRAE
eukprot:3316563-Amphidinium_carterae.1